MDAPTQTTHLICMHYIGN